MNYGIGDIVTIKSTIRSEKEHAKKFIYLGSTNDRTIKPITYTKFVMGEDIQIGMFVSTPIEPIFVDNKDYVLKLLFFDTELFEKDE